MNKASVIGVGSLGSCIAYEIARRDLVDELILIDKFHEIAEGNATDINQALAFTNNVKINAGDYKAGEWLHVALTREFPNKKLNAWANGVKKIDNVDVTINDPPISIAPQIVNSKEPCLGVVDEVAIFNVLLSEEDIQKVANGGLEGAIQTAAVKPVDKLTTTWADIKAGY